MGGEVLVAGAGPVGMTMAAVLARLGVGVRIIDPAHARTDKSKALVIWPRTLELLDIQGCAQDFLEAGIKGHGMRILAGGREIVRVTLDGMHSIYRFALMIPQSETERLLEEELARRGVAVERGVEVQGFTGGETGINAALRHADGRIETAETPFLIGCDGAHSTVRHGLSIEFEGSTEPSDWLLADLRLDGDLPQDEITICWTGDGVLALFPIVGGRYRVIADVGLLPTDAAPPPDLAEIQAVLDSRGPPGLRAHDPFWLSRFRINERKVRDYRKGRVFLAGDAAHIHSPAGGQGMNTGMQDAFNLGWKLALAWRGLAGETLLASYSPERSGIGEQVLRNATGMTHLAILRNPILQELRNVAAGVLGHIPAFRQRLIDQLSEVDLHYADGPITAHGRGAASHPGNGHRAPDLPVRQTHNGAVRLHEMLRDGHFVLLSVGTAPLEVPPEFTRAALAARADPNGSYVDDHHYLIRPDAYVATSTRAEDPEPILAQLRAMLAG